MKKYNNFLYVFLALTLILSTPGLSNLVVNAYASVNINDIIGGYLDGMPSPGGGGNSWPWPNPYPEPSPTPAPAPHHTRTSSRTSSRHQLPPHQLPHQLLVLLNNCLQDVFKIKLLE